MALCDCEDDLEGVNSDPCSQINYGSQIVEIYLQDMEGEEFDGTSGNTVSVAADWQSKFAATGVDKIVRIPNITATMPSQDPTIEEGQDVPYGGAEVIEYPFLIEGVIRYIQQSTFTQVETLSNCKSGLRLWFRTNLNYVFGASVQADATLGKGFGEVKFIGNTFGINGIGTKSKIPFKLRKVTDCGPKPVGQLSFLQNI